MIRYEIWKHRDDYHTRKWEVITHHWIDGEDTIVRWDLFSTWAEACEYVRLNNGSGYVDLAQGV